MVDKPKKLSDLIQEVFDEQAQSAILSPEEIEADVVQLRQMFREIREQATTQLLVYEKVLRPGAYRLQLGNLTFRVTLGAARRTSRIVVDAARDLLTGDPHSWGVLPALVTRGAEDLSHVEIGQQSGSASGSVIADDLGEEPRVLVEIRGFPAGQPVPIMEIGEETPGLERAQVQRVDPEILPERLPSGRGRPGK
jgi:hypothetical protein